MKYLLWALLIYLAWRWIKASQRKDRPAQADSPSGTDIEPALAGTERMVRCEQCGIYLPASEALPDAGALHYCSAAHRDLHRSQHTQSPNSR